MLDLSCTEIFSGLDARPSEGSSRDLVEALYVSLIYEVKGLWIIVGQSRNLRAMV